jgi:hypothetical protein
MDLSSIRAKYFSLTPSLLYILLFKKWLIFSYYGTHEILFFHACVFSCAGNSSHYHSLIKPTSTYNYKNKKL